MKPGTGAAAIIVLLAALRASLAAPVDSTDATEELPPLARDGEGVVRVDLNADGHDDLVVSNDRGYGVYLFVPPDRAIPALEWQTGWTRVMREGHAGDADSLPPLTGADVAILPDCIRVGGHALTFTELLRVPGPPPRSPEDARSSMQLCDGFVITLAASEPLVMDPVFVDWDERGRMWVAEMGDYPLAEDEATKDGLITWKDGVPGEGADRPLRTGRVRILEDLDGDGHYDTSRLFLEGLRHVTGLACWQGGVFVASVPDIVYARDTDGDGMCDVRDTWFRGFTTGNSQHLVNGFCWGLDGWLYGANGDSSGTIECVKTGETVPLGRSDFRFDPRTGALELEAGCTQCGKWRDDFGNWFGTDNTSVGWHYWLPMAHLERHPELVVKAIRADLTTDRSVFTAGARERRLNQASRGSMLTAACNPLPYRDVAFGEDGSDALFVCDPAHHVVIRRVLDYEAEVITARRHAGDAHREFLASDDAWFRPVMARTGPDGALYVVDMYRLVLEHPEWIPADMARHMQLRGGETMGRIWRIARSGQSARPTPIRLDSPNGWSRDTAQRLAFERGSLDDESAVRRLARSADTAVRTQALFTLHGLGLLPADDVQVGLQPLWPRVRGAALVAAGAKRLPPREEALVAERAMSPGRTASEMPTPAIGHVESDRRRVVARYLAAAALSADADRGRAIYARVGCAACHRLGSEGAALGPDMATVASKPAAQLIEAIFDPSRAVEERFKLTAIVLDDGTVTSGIVAVETPGSLVLRVAGGGERVVARSGIDEMLTLEKSIMPEGLESLLSVQDCADLLAAIRNP